ncbi:MAG TPA: response regulator [Terracidiphilus sp.]|nr:response regulator [Terracidiphilus sp.]
MKSKSNFPVIPVKDVPKSDSAGDSESYRTVVLVVDDESVIADTLVEILNRNGYAAIAAYDAEGALETALVTPPELLITDVVLPEMNGIELAITVRRIFPDCKILLFSGQASTSGLLAMANREGHQFSLINKPVHPRDLLERVTDIFKGKREQVTVSPS